MSKNGWVILILVLIGIAFVSEMIGLDDSISQASQGPDHSDVCLISREFVKRNLRSPSTAEFPVSSESNCTATQDRDIWTVRSYVDAQNGFGATVRSDYGVEMRYHSDRGTWTLLNIMIVDR